MNAFFFFDEREKLFLSKEVKVQRGKAVHRRETSRLSHPASQQLMYYTLSPHAEEQAD